MRCQPRRLYEPPLFDRIQRGVLVGNDRNPALSVGYGPVTIPAIAIEGLRSKHNILDGGSVAPNTVVLNHVFRFLAGSNQCRCLPGAKYKHIMHARPPLGEVIADKIVVRQVAVHTNSLLPMCAVIPILILGVHNVAVIAGGWIGPGIRRGICDIDKNAYRNEGDSKSEINRKFRHATLEGGGQLLVISGRQTISILIMIDTRGCATLHIVLISRVNGK